MTDVLLTGASGFVGKVVLTELLCSAEHNNIERIWLLMRSRKGRSAWKRWEGMRCAPPLRGYRPKLLDRVHVVEGAIEKRYCGIDRKKIPEKGFSHVIHCAASVDFDLPLVEAYAINTRGTRQLYELTSALPSFERFVYVSTAYVHPHRPGRLRPTPISLPWSADEFSRRLQDRTAARMLLRESGYPNTYTLTKALAENSLLEAEAHPEHLAIVRPSIISACLQRPEPGWLEGSAGLNGVVRLYGSGVLRTIVFDPKTFLDVVPCDEVAAHIQRATFDHDFPRISHAVAGIPQSLKLETLARDVIAFFEGRVVIRKPRVVSTERSMGIRYWLVSLVFHLLPWSLLSAMKKIRGHDREARKLWALTKTLAAIGRTFGHFSRTTYDFEAGNTEFALDTDRYPRLICEAVAEHLIRPLNRKPIDRPTLARR